MNRAPQRPAFAYAPDDVADTHYLLTHADTLAHLPKDYYEDTIRQMWALLHKNRAAQQQPQPPTTTTARVLHVSAAVFEAGPASLRHPRHRITLGPTTTPGDAA